MNKKRIVSIIMLVVLAIGIACIAYGVTGTKIYENAVVMMGSDKKSAMGYIQNPEKLTELGSLSKIGAKAEESGTMQGVALAAYWDAHPEADLNGDGVIQYVMIKGEPGHQDAELRTEYSIKYLTDNGYQVECLAEDTAMWDRVKGQDKMATFLAAHPDEIEAVFANNDDMALGVIAALNEQGYNTGKEGDPSIAVIGVDATDGAIEAIKAGKMTATVKQDGDAMGEANIRFMMNYLLNGAFYPGMEDSYKLNEDGVSVFIPYAKITVENIGE